MAIETNVTTTGYKVKLEINDGAGGIPNQTVDAGIYWDPDYLRVDSLSDPEFDIYNKDHGVIMWCKVKLPLKNVFKVDLKRVNPGTTYIMGSAVDCETGDKDTDLEPKS